MPLCLMEYWKRFGNAYGAPAKIIEVSREQHVLAGQILFDIARPMYRDTWVVGSLGRLNLP